MNTLTTRPVEGVVFPSEEATILVEYDQVYGGAHKYFIKNCQGFKDGKTEYADSIQEIQFVEKLDNGLVVYGVQSEQLALVLLDRVKKLNARFPSPYNEKQIQGLEIFLEACRDRVRERIERGVMGELKK